MSYRSHTISPFSATGAPVVVNLPAGVLDDDIITIVVLMENSSNVAGVILPAGFTEVLAQPEIMSGVSATRQRGIVVGQKVASSEPSTYTITSVTIKQIYVVAHSGRSGLSTPIYTGVTSDQTSNYATALTGYTAVADDDVLIIGNHASDTASSATSFAPPTSYTERNESIGAWLTHAMFTRDALSSGATGSISYDTVITGGNAAGFGVVIPLAAVAGGLTLDSTPADNRVTESRSVTVSTPAVVPTTGNTEIKLTDDTGQAATVDSVTGSDPYVINYTFPRTTAKKLDATGYPIYIEVAAENVTSANVPFLPVSTQRFIDLSSPVATAGTYGAIYAGAVAATGDQRVHDIVSTSESIPLDADGAAYGAEQDFWAIRSQPIATQTATFYLIQADGTVDVEDTITFEVETPVTDSGILRSILRSPLKDILRTPIK